MRAGTGLWWFALICQLLPIAALIGAGIYLWLLNRKGRRNR